MATAFPQIVATPTFVKKPLPFKDLGKPVNDLFTKGFPSTYKFELTTAAENGMKFVASVERKTREVSDSSGGKTKQDYIFSSFQPKIEIKEKGITFNGTLDTDKLEGELILADLLQKGVKTTFKATAFDNSKQEISGDLEYRTDSAAVNSGILWKDNAYKLNFSTVVGYEGISLGGTIGYFLPIGNVESSLDNFSLAANYTSGKYDITNLFNGKKEKGDYKLSVGAKILYNHSVHTNFAADLTYDPLKSLKDGVSLKLLGGYKFDDNTTMKAKVDTVGNVSLAYSQKAYSNLTLTVATEVNALKVEDHKVGFSLAFAP